MKTSTLHQRGDRITDAQASTAAQIDQPLRPTGVPGQLLCVALKRPEQPTERSVADILGPRLPSLNCSWGDSDGIGELIDREALVTAPTPKEIRWMPYCFSLSSGANLRFTRRCTFRSAQRLRPYLNSSDATGIRTCSPVRST